jgi:DNA-binding NtrC family response regulator
MSASRDVLVVEPADDDQLGLCGALGRAGLTADSSPDAAHALASLASKPYGMVIADPRTPGLTAAALAEALRRLTPRPVALVIIDDAEPGRRSTEADVIHGYVRHDTDADQLVELIRDCLDALRDTKSVAAKPSQRQEMSVC